VEQQAGTLFKGRILPRFERLQSRVHRGLDVLLAGFLVGADNLRRLGGIDGLDLLGGLDVFAADDQIELATQLAAHFFDSRTHLARIVFAAEVNRGLVAERTFVQADLQARRSFHGCHKCTSLGISELE
jgi:hypothetical protein